MSKGVGFWHEGSARYLAGLELDEASEVEMLEQQLASAPAEEHEALRSRIAEVRRKYRERRSQSQSALFLRHPEDAQP